MSVAPDLHQHLLASIEDCLVAGLDRDGYVLTWNTGAARMTGYSPEEAAGKHFSVLATEESRVSGRAGQRLEVAVRDGAYEAEEWCVRKDGSRFLAEVVLRALHDDAGELVGFAYIVHDLTERRHADDRMEELRRWNQLVLTASGEGIYGLDAQGLTTFVNPAAARMVGWEPHELIGRSQHDVIHHSHRDGTPYLAEECPIYAAFRDGEVHRVDNEVFWRKDGTSFPVEYVSSPIVEDGKLVGAVVVFRDLTGRRKEQAALRQANDDLQAIIRASPMAVIVLDGNGRVETWNRAAERVFGWSEAEVLGTSPPTIPDDRRAEFEREVARALAGDTVVGLETERLTRSGARVPVRISTAPLRNSEGEIRGAVAITEDVTERRQAEEAQRRLIAILEATPDIVSFADPGGRVLYVNRAGREIFGLRDPERQPDPVNVADYHPQWAASLIMGEAIPTAIRAGSWSGETAVKTADGKEIPVLQVVIAHRSSDGEVEYISTIMRDITERKRAEEVHRFLADASQLLSRSLERDEILREVPALLVPRLADYCLIDLFADDGTLTRVAAQHRDEALREITERLRAFPPDLGGSSWIAEVLRTGKSALVPVVTDAALESILEDPEHLRLVQELHPVSSLIVPLLVRGRVIGAITCARSEPGRSYTDDDVAVAEDLASRVALAIDNARLFSEIRQAVHTRDEVLRIVAHDLRNPLNTIGLSAAVLMETAPPGVTALYGKQLQIMQRSLDRADALIQDLLDVARLQGRTLTVELTRLDLRELIQEAIDSARIQAEDKDLKLHTELEDDLPIVPADHDRMLQVLGNLIGNAIKFTPPGGRVTVEAKRCDKTVEVAVADTGPGIPPEHVDHLFDPFWQGHSPSREGAGLGLAIAKAIVEAHGGLIRVESETGSGSCFTIALPVTGPRRDDGAAPQAAASGVRPGEDGPV